MSETTTEPTHESTLDDMDFKGLAWMVNESIERVEHIYRRDGRRLEINDICSHIEDFVPERLQFQHTRDITTQDEFIERVLDAFITDYGAAWGITERGRSDDDHR